jgi:predicted transglutaminase-like cysteine proteinase
MLAAGLWLTASACWAAPQPEPNMQLGASALPPRAYVAFCQRRPQDCGADPAQVLAAAAKADAERAQLLAALSPTQAEIEASAPAAMGDRPQAGFALASYVPTAPVQTLAFALPEPLQAVIVAKRVETTVAFIDPVAEARRAEASTPAMTPDLWAKLNRINDKMNRKIARRTDRDGYGLEDFWTTPLAEGRSFGDCEDYVLEKQRALADAGVPRKALNIALVTTSWGEAHAVLLVSTRDGDYVLDNLSPFVRSWRKTDYRWRQRQVDGDAFTWAMAATRPAREPAPADGRLLIAALR